MKNTDTIAAIATPPGTGGVAVVRISGAKSEKIISELFNSDARKYDSRKMYFGTLSFGGVRDDCLAVIFRSPNSYTGEDVAEIHCHGGRVLTRCVLEAVLACGARLAVNGEFTKRAFINGKLSLAEGEGVADMISAESRAELNASYGEMSGALTGRVKGIQDELTDILSEIEVAIDYPEEELELSHAREKLSRIAKDLAALEAGYETGRRIREGINVGIVGKPNAGKSSLLNALLGVNRAIVTPIAGTTRDTVTESLDLGGVRFNLTDTAGIREDGGEIEMLGVELSKGVIASCDIALFVLDGAEGVTDDDGQIAKLLRTKPVVEVWNKSDLDGFTVGETGLDAKAKVAVSASTGKGVRELAEILPKAADVENISERGLILLGVRHRDAVRRARLAAEFACGDLCGMLGAAAMEIREVWDALGEITGTTATEDIIDNVFSKFCLGK